MTPVQFAEEVADLALMDAIPCEMHVRRDGEYVPCENEADYRVHVNCNSCSYARYRFLCQSCFDMLQRKSAMCGKCRSRDLTWRMT